MQFMADKDSATLLELFLETPRKIIAIMTFLAILELVKSRRLVVQQSLPFAEVRVYRGDHFEEGTHILTMKKSTPDETAGEEIV